MNEPMKPEFDCALAASVLEATYGLSQDAHCLLTLLLQKANWREGSLSGRLPDAGYLTTWFELSDCGLVSRTGTDHFQIHYEMLMPDTTQRTAP
jgi:hypothetical protein